MTFLTALFLATTVLLVLYLIVRRPRCIECQQKAMPHISHALIKESHRADVLEPDAARWRTGCSIGFPEYCPHWEGEPTGDGWYHQHTGDQAFRSATAAMDAAIKRVCVPSTRSNSQ